MRRTSAILLSLTFSCAFAVVLLLAFECRHMIFALLSGSRETGAQPSVRLDAVSTAQLVNTSAAVDMSPIDPNASVTPTEVTADNWRDVLARLNNIYTEAGVLRERNAAVARFVALAESSDHQPSFAQRHAIRQAAAKELGASEIALGHLITDGPRAARDQAAVALLEEQLLAGEFRAAIAEAIPLTQRLPAGDLRDQAYFYLIDGYQGVPDAAASLACLKEFSALNQTAVNRFFVPMPPLGLLRSMASCFSNAQVMDDSTVLVPGSQIAASAITLRDKSRAQAPILYKQFNVFYGTPAARSAP